MNTTQPDAAVVPSHQALSSSRASRGKVLSWAMWDWGTQPFATVITTFVFAVYLTSDAFGPANYTDKALGVAMSVAGLFVAVLAPVLGQGADRSGKRMLFLRWQTWALAGVSASLWFVAPAPEYFLLGLVLLGVGNVIQEIAGVNYYASIDQVATPANVGRVSGLGWGMGYLGGILIMLLIVGLRGADFGPDDVRFSMLICGLWTLLFTIPLFLAVRDEPVADAPAARSIPQAYRDLFASVRRLWRQSPNTIFFLLASALFRDGLAGVFTFGAVIASGSYGFSFGEVMVFGIAANLTAGVATIIFGLWDDRLGPKKVIMFSLSALSVLGLLVFVLHDAGKTVFWVCGLLLTLFVGPAQSASRSFLARAIPEGRSGEIFGLYATTGRAVSFLSPAAWTGALVLGEWITGSDDVQYFGILGIVLVLLAGLIVMIPVKETGHRFD